MSGGSKPIPIDLIDRPEDPLRNTIEEEAIDELAHSMSVHGLLHPIRLRPKGSRFEVITGDRRLAAARRLHWTTIHAILADTPEDALLEVRIHENLHRLDLTPSEEARRVVYLHEKENWPLHRIASALGKSLSWVEIRIDMAAWPDGLIQLVDEKKISLGVARILNLVENDTALQYLATQAAETGATIAQARAWLQSYRSKPWQLPTKEEIDAAKEMYHPPPIPKAYCAGCDMLEEVQNVATLLLCPACQIMLRKLRRQNP